MIIGHLGFAFAGRALRAVPLRWLIVASYLPDVVRLTVRPFVSLAQSELLSHSIPAVAVLAALVAGAWLLKGGAWGAALLLAALCALHLPLDLVTGCKELSSHGPWVGLQLYVWPFADFSLEAALVLIGWFIARRLGVLGRSGTWRVPAVLCCIQAAVLVAFSYNTVFLIGIREYVWVPARTGPWPQLVGNVAAPRCTGPQGVAVEHRRLRPPAPSTSYVRVAENSAMVRRSPSCSWTRGE